MTTTPEWAIPEMAVLAAAMRGDWDMNDITGALLAAQGANWTPARGIWELARLIGDGDATPRELRDAARRPVRGKPVSVPPPAGWLAGPEDGAA